MTKQSSLIGWLCKQCGSSEQNSHGGCSECARASRRRYRLAHPDRVAASAKKFVEKTPMGRAAYDATYHAARYLANKEKILAQAQAWRANNRERAREVAAARYARNTEALIAKAKAWAASNPEAVKAIRSNRRARKRDARGKLSPDITAVLYKLQKGKCPCCGQPLGRDYHLDHKMPLALGGAHEDDNMQLLRAKCNLQKSMRHPVEFMQSRGFLL